jgi:muconolactone delta-isomerase
VSEFLVTMTTHVPADTAPSAVDEVRAREAAHSAELAAQGRLLRLWRPPLQPGEWRTLGLFVAADLDGLESVLASMPLRIWRTDETLPLLPHPNDPGPETEAPPEGWTEYLATFTITIPEGTGAAEVAEAEEREAACARELAREGHLGRLWRLDETGVLGLWRASSPDQLRETLAALPFAPWMQVATTPLSEHPSDPASRTR